VFIRIEGECIQMWDERAQVPKVAERWLLGVLGSLTVVISLLFMTIMMWTLISDHGGWWGSGIGRVPPTHSSRVGELLILCMAVTTGVVLGAELVRLRQRLLFPLNFSSQGGCAYLRTASLGAVALAQVLLLPAWNLLGVVPVGAIIGAELASRSSRLLKRTGAGQSSMLAMRRTVMVLSLFGVLAILRSGQNWAIASVVSTGMMELSALLLVGCASAWVVHLGLTDLGKRMSREVSGYVRGLRQVDLRNRAQWVHDHLLSELSLVILRLQSMPDPNEEAIRLLRDVDHRLRLAQIDDLIESGSMRIASLVQPHVRRSLQLGVEVNPLPGFEQVDVAVDSDTGRLISRVLAVLFSNAMNAGAHRIGLDVIVDSTGVEILVTDDAGGFDLGDLHPGRGLEELMTDLGRGGVVREEIVGGSVMRVTVPRSMLMDDFSPRVTDVRQASKRRRMMTKMRSRYR
jgi:hypothetical protein